MLESQPQRIIVAVGLPGSGKSTYFAQRRITPLSSDWLRLLLADDITEQGFQPYIFLALRFLLRVRLRIGRRVTYIDATSVTPAERAQYIRIGRRRACRMEAIFFDSPLSVCLERNRSRDRRVPEEGMLRLASALVPPTLEEGFYSITRIGADGNSTTQISPGADPPSGQNRKAGLPT